MNSDSDQAGAKSNAQAGQSSPVLTLNDGASTSPGLSAEELEAEAIAEEEFVADLEDRIENPLVLDEYDNIFPSGIKDEDAKKDDVLAGSIVSGKTDTAFNNEQALREEKMDDQNKNKSVAPEEAAPVVPTPEIPVVSAAEAPVTPATTVAEPILGAAPLGMETEQVTASPIEPMAGATEVSAVTSELGASPVISPIMSAGVLSEAPVAPIVSGPTVAAPGVTGGVAAPMTAAAKADKAKNKKFIILISSVLGALVLIALAVGLFAFMNNPEKIAMDAMSKILTSRSVNMRGRMDVDTALYTAGSDLEVDNATNDFRLARNQANFSAKFEIGLHDIEDMDDFSIGIDAVVVSDQGEIYGRINNLSAFFESFVDSAASEFKDIPESQFEAMGLKSSDIDRFVKSLRDAGLKVFGAIDGVWVRFDEKSIKDEDAAKEFKKLIEAIKTVQSEEYSQKVLNIYREHAFVKIDEHAEVKSSEDGIKMYPIEIDETNYKAYSKELSRTKEMKDLRHAAEGLDLVSVLESDSVEASFNNMVNEQRQLLKLAGLSHYDIKLRLSELLSREEEEMQEIDELRLGIKGFNHEVKRIYVAGGVKLDEYEDEFSDFELRGDIDYEADEIKAPGESKDLEQFANDLAEAMIGFLRSYVTAMGRLEFAPECRSLNEGEAMAQDCMDDVEKRIGEEFDKEYVGDITDLGGGLIGSAEQEDLRDDMITTSLRRGLELKSQLKSF